MFSFDQRWHDGGKVLLLPNKGDVEVPRISLHHLGDFRVESQLLQCEKRIIISTQLHG